MRLVILAAGLAAASTLSAQRPRETKLGTWTVEYDHTVLHMHGDPTHTHQRGRLSLHSVGDSLFGELVVGDSAATDRSILRGAIGKGGWVIYSEEPRPTGFAVMMIPIEVAMDWLRETVHGMQPRVVRFDLVAKGDSVVGTRTVTGGMAGTPARVSAVRGMRAKP